MNDQLSKIRSVPDGLFGLNLYQQSTDGNALGKSFGIWLLHRIDAGFKSGMRLNAKGTFSFVVSD